MHKYTSELRADELGTNAIVNFIILSPTWQMLTLTLNYKD
jgi:hypothetical protein